MKKTVLLLCVLVLAPGAALSKSPFATKKEASKVDPNIQVQMEALQNEAANLRAVDRGNDILLSINGKNVTRKDLETPGKSFQPADVRANKPAQVEVMPYNPAAEKPQASAQKAALPAPYVPKASPAAVAPSPEKPSALEKQKTEAAKPVPEPKKEPKPDFAPPFKNAKSKGMARLRESGEVRVFITNLDHFGDETKTASMSQASFEIYKFTKAAAPCPDGLAYQVGKAAWVCAQDVTVTKHDNSFPYYAEAAQ